MLSIITSSARLASIIISDPGTNQMYFRQRDGGDTPLYTYSGLDEGSQLLQSIRKLMGIEPYVLYNSNEMFERSEPMKDEDK